MDLRGFVTDAGEPLSEVVVLTGEKAGKVMPSGIVPSGSERTMVNPAVDQGDWIIPLKLIESQVVVAQVTRFDEGRPIADRPGVFPLAAKRWIRLDSDVSQNEGFLEWSMRLRETLLLEGFAAQTGARMWGKELRKVLEAANIEPMPVWTEVTCHYSIRWNRRNALEKMASGMDKVLAIGEHAPINVKARVEGTVRLANALAECRCDYWRGSGLPEDRDLDTYSEGYRALVAALRPRIPPSAELTDVRVKRVRCGYCA